MNKLFFSNQTNQPLEHTVLKHQWENFIDVWNNTSGSRAIGIERILKLILILSQFLSPAIFVRAIFGRKGVLSKHVATEFYVFFKLVSAVTILYFHLFDLKFFGIIFLLWIIWMILETIFYTANLVFCSDVFAKPYSHKRNVILILIDYMHLNFDYASLYLAFGALKQGDSIVKSSLDAAYFSFISSLTIGYGDIVPSIWIGKLLVITQVLVFLLFGVVFINFYTSRLEEEPK